MPSRPRRMILVAVRDPSAASRGAIRKAARLAARSDARVKLFHAFVVPEPASGNAPATPEAMISATQRNLQADLQRMARSLQRAGIKVECEVVWDFPAAHAIVRAAMACKADLVVAESHRRSRLSRWFLANPDWELIRECPCPVWFVKTERLSRRPLVLVAVDPRHARAKPSNLDDRLLKAATALTAELDGRTSLIHVEDKADLSPATQAETRAAVSRLATRHDIPAAAQTLLSGTPARVLARSAAAMSADVLVMGAVSRSGLRQAFIGSTAEAVIDEVNCDVLVVKPKGFRTSISRQTARLPGR